MINVFPFFKKHFAGCLILITSMALGFIIFGNYGIAWDEPEQREVGLKTFNYVFHGDTSLNEFKDRYYGVAVELPLIFLEKTLRLEDPRAIYRMRHSVTHLFFLLCAFIFYLLIWVLFRNKPLAVAGYLMLLLSPRIYAQSFFNTKDIPFMCMFIPCFLASVIAFRDKKILNFIVFGILSGLLINIRIMGIMLPVFVTIMILIDLIKGPLRKKTLVNYGVYIFFMVMVTFLTWPWLWKAPLAHFWEAFTCMSKYKWNGNILVYGNYVRASAIDWMYIPHWFGLTTPLLYLFFGTIGFGFLVTRFLREPGVFLFPTNDRNYLLYLVSFLSPVILVILLHSTLYDGWRQMYFIYPAFLLVAIYGLSALLNSKIFSGDMLRVAIFTLVLLSFTGTASTMVKSHPFEDIYFNSLLSKNCLLYTSPSPRD